MGLPLASARWSQVEGRRTSSKLVAHPRTFPGGLCFVKLFNSQEKDYVTRRHPTPSYTLPQWLLEWKTSMEKWVTNLS